MNTVMQKDLNLSFSLVTETSLSLHLPSLLSLSKYLIKKVEVNGVEPMTPCLQSRCSSQLSYTPNFQRSL